MCRREMQITSWELNPNHISDHNKSQLIKVVSDDHVRSAYVLRKVKSAGPVAATMIRGPPAATNDTLPEQEAGCTVFFPLNFSL